MMYLACKLLNFQRVILVNIQRSGAFNFGRFGRHRTERRTGQECDMHYVVTVFRILMRKHWIADVAGNWLQLKSMTWY